MNLINISGNTFYIRGGTNTGLYLFDDNSALIIDPGLSGARPNKIIKILNERNIELKYIINTHEHNDHFGACSQFKEYYKDVEILSSGKSNIFMDEKLKNRSPKDISIDTVITEGILSINNKKFEVFNFKGHTPGSIGVLTDDKVLFVGDLLVGEEMLSKYDFLFLQDVEEYLKSLDIVKSLDFNYIVLAHGKKVLDKNDTILLIEKHKQAVHKYLCQIIENLKVPMNVDTLLKKIIKENELTYNYKEYYFFRTSLVSFISYLADLDKINYKLEDSDLLYYTKIK